MTWEADRFDQLESYFERQRKICNRTCAGRGPCDEKIAAGCVSNPRSHGVIVAEQNVFQDLVRLPKPGLNESNEPAGINHI